METDKGEGKSIITLPELDDEGEEDEDTGEDNKKKIPLTPSKRRGSGAGGSTLRSCQVENCTADMNDAKPYHRRHKVCGFHAKAPEVPLGGLQQRFCQQCSRFDFLCCLRHFGLEPSLAKSEVNLIYEREKCSVGFLLSIHVLAVMPCRFHEVSEFDEAKRSCRRRLAGHNERRRKSSYES